MTHINTNIPYQGATPGADSDTYPLFSTITAFTGKNFFPLNGIERFTLVINNPQAGTINSYFSDDHTSANRTQVSTTAKAASAANTSDFVEFFVGVFEDWELEFVNGGVAQTGWKLQLGTSQDRTILT